jgi:SagB-type dehydrogenase family enzyme
MTSRVVPTAEFASLVYGPDGVAVDDPAEAFHEASRLYPNVAPGRLATILALARSDGLQQTAARSGRTHDHRPGLDLPHVALGRARLGGVLTRRRSSAPVRGSDLALADLAAALGASYASDGGTRRRPVPSGGALYPLELYVLALRVDGLERAVLHYNPFRHRLELLAALDPARARETLVDPSLLDHASALIVVTGMFWRSRFKYGARGYRFTLLEAGHVVQNTLLAATALGVPALPLGGFYDCRLDALVGADGVDESTLYAVVVGGSQ